MLPLNPTENASVYSRSKCLINAYLNTFTYEFRKLKKTRDRHHALRKIQGTNYC